MRITKHPCEECTVIPRTQKKRQRKLIDAGEVKSEARTSRRALADQRAWHSAQGHRGVAISRSAWPREPRAALVTAARGAPLSRGCPDAPRGVQLGAPEPRRAPRQLPLRRVAREGAQGPAGRDEQAVTPSLSAPVCPGLWFPRWGPHPSIPESLRTGVVILDPTSRGPATSLSHMAEDGAPPGWHTGPPEVHRCPPLAAGPQGRFRLGPDAASITHCSPWS